jgi:hypothetical protein
MAASMSISMWKLHLPEGYVKSLTWKSSASCYCDVSLLPLGRWFQVDMETSVQIVTGRLGAGIIASINKPRFIKGL